jgi:hypothetical protein
MNRTVSKSGASDVGDMFSLAPSIDLADLAREYALQGRVQIAPFLSEHGAAFLARHLLARTDWNFTLNSDDRTYEVPRHGVTAMSPEQESRLRNAVEEKAVSEFQFCYDSIRVPDVRAERDIVDPLHRFAEFMCGGPVLALMRSITQNTEIAFADAQATIYRNRDFLTAHDDAVAEKHRVAAYVLGLTAEWRTEWGGLLMFHDSRGDVERALIPRFNTLTMFRVPKVHSVSAVAAAAARPRCSITGWLRKSQ